MSKYLSETPILLDSHHLLPLGAPRDGHHPCGRWQCVAIGSPHVATCHPQCVHGKGTVGKGDTEGGGNGGVPVDPSDQAAGRVEDMGGKRTVRGGKEQAACVIEKEGGRRAGWWQVHHRHSQTITGGSNSLHLGRFKLSNFQIWSCCFTSPGNFTVIGESAVFS